MNEIKRCPFCGGRSILACGGQDTVSHFVLCKGCFASSQEILEYGMPREMAREIAVEMWNRRQVENK